MPKPESKGEFAAGRDAEHCGACRGEGQAEACGDPAANVFDEELFVCREALRLKAR
jgi:hypothetical protein